MSRMKEAKAALLDRVEEIVRELVPGGHKNGGVYTAKNPARADRHAGSFVVWLRGPGAGAWKDFSTGEAGDIIDLCALAKGTDRKGALAWAEDRCNLKTMSWQARQELGRVYRERRESFQRQEEHFERRAIDQARKRFAAAEPHGLQAAPVKRYLAGRGVPVEALRGIEPATFRFEPQAEYWLGRRDGVPGPRFPALVSAMVDQAGLLGALHWTFLAPDGSGKAPVEKPKLMYPRTAGLAVRVSRGMPRNLSAEDAAKQGQAGQLVLTEGIEDALSVAYACHELRVWAAGSLPGFLHLSDHACASGYLLLRDNDWDKPQAQELFLAALQNFRRWKKPVEVAAAPGAAKDFNDLLRSDA